jgi:hypothetical protein
MNTVKEAPRISSMDEWLGVLSRRSPDVAIFQNVYSDAVVASLDPSFLPVEGRQNARTQTREIGLFLRMFHSGLYRCAPLTGILSPKFNAKARVSGATFLQFIRGNPGYNVYFINPMPQNIYYTFNVWHHGEVCHPGLMALAEILFDRAGFDTGLILGPRDAHATALYCSYWVGDEQFWNGYLTFVIRLMEALQSLPERLLHRYFALDPEYPDPVSVVPFIFERSFTAYLHHNPRARALAYPFTRRDMLPYCNSFEREIVLAFGEVIDEIDRRKQYTAADREIFYGIARLRVTAARHDWPIEA